jgi:hypothetical protein
MAAAPFATATALSGSLVIAAPEREVEMQRRIISSKSSSPPLPLDNCSTPDNSDVGVRRMLKPSLYPGGEAEREREIDQLNKHGFRMV